MNLSLIDNEIGLFFEQRYEKSRLDAIIRRIHYRKTFLQLFFIYSSNENTVLVKKKGQEEISLFSR